MLSVGRGLPGFVVVVVLLTGPAMAGCLGPDVPEGPEGFHVILVETSYDASERPEGNDRPEDQATDLPAGHPASDLELWFRFIAGGPDYEGETWDHDPPCPNGENFHGPWADCEEFDRQESYVLPSPRDAKGYARIEYPLDGDGEVVFHVPQDMKLGFEVDDLYTDALWDKADDPDRCDERPNAASKRIAAEGGAERTSPSSFVVTGDVRLVVHWYGTCPDRFSS